MSSSKELSNKVVLENGFIYSQEVEKGLRDSRCDKPIFPERTRRPKKEQPARLCNRAYLHQVDMYVYCLCKQIRAVERNLGLAV